MEKKIYFIEPVFEAKYWGGQALKERYGYTPDLPNIAIAYHVIALPQHNLDNTVKETGEKLSEFYRNHKELFGCNREDFPIRMGSGNKVKQISVQLHPNDEYCLQHEGEKGKFECGIFVQGDRDHLAIRGHNAKTREEFRKLVETEQWDKLFRVVTIIHMVPRELFMVLHMHRQKKKKIWWSLDLKQIQILHTGSMTGDEICRIDRSMLKR